MSSLVFRITGDPASFKAAMGEVSGALDTTAKKAALVSDVFGRMGSALTLGITVPAVAAGAAVIKAAADMDSLKCGLTAVAGSSEEAEKQLVRLKEVAKLPGLGFREAIQGSINLQAAGFSATLAERSLKAFGNALATVGKGKSELDGVGLALSQIASKGKISAEEINQLNERVPQIRAAMKAAFGTADTEVLQKAGIGAQEFVERVVAQLEKLPQVTGGVKNAFENLTDAVEQSAVRVGNKLIPTVEKILPKLESMAVGVADLVDGFTNLPGPIQNTAIAMGTLLIAAGPVAGVIGKTVGAIGSIKAVAGVAGVALGSLFGAAIIASIGQTMSDLDKLSARYKDLADEIERRKKGLQDTIKGQENIGIGGVRTRETFQVPELIGDKGNAAARLQIDLQGISKELNLFGVATDKAKVAGDAHTLTLGKTSGALKDMANVITVTSVAMRDANGELSKTSLVYVESLERTKAAIGRVKDVMYEYITAGTLIGKTIQTHPAILDAATLGAQEYAARLGDIRRELEHMPAPRVQDVNMGNLRRGSVFETDDILGGSSSRNQAARVAQAEADLARIKQLNQEGKATGRDVITAQENLRKAIDDTGDAAVRSGKKQSRALQQVSTIMTDLSRGIANAGVGLVFDTLFDKGSKDVQRFKDDIVALEAEQQKLIAAQGTMSEETAKLRDEESKLLAAQTKGHNVTAQLAVVRAQIIESEKKGGEALIEVQKKLAEANKRMGEELHKASFGFRAMEAGKAVIEDLAKSIVRTLIEGALTQLGKKLLDVSGIMGKVFGGGASGPGGTIFSAASGSGASAAGGAASSAGGGVASAASGLMGTISAVTGIVSAVSDVIGNFQFMAMNKSLDLIEHETRFSQIHLLNTLNKANEFWPELRNIHARLVEIREVGVKIEGGGTGDIHVDMAGAFLMSDNQMAEFGDRLIRLLKARGVQFA